MKKMGYKSFIEFLNSAQMLEHASDFINYCKDRTTPYTLNDSNGLNAIALMEYDDCVNVRFYVSDPENLIVYLTGLPRNKKLKFEFKEKWMIDCAKSLFDIKFCGHNFNYVYDINTADLHTDKYENNAKLLGEQDIAAIMGYVNFFQPRLPEKHPFRLDNVLKAQLRGEPLGLFGQIKNGELVNYVSIESMKIKYNEMELWDVNNIWTSCAYRRHGLAKETLNFCVKWLREGNKLPYYSGVSSDNIASQKTCEAVGYIRCSETWFFEEYT